ncbi:unnamed protein product [Brachionus calyciflorus]|uniref:FLYWCH-type domain-containing protein n=1 Tax=Brachionus calyciflorus TaxID=104777 RepID=A0A814FIR1_9BILA|nr:unnamed protein product [Brachionus calyciflorus]
MFYKEIGSNLSNAEESNEEDSEPNGLTIVKTKLGKPKLCYEGHYYAIDKVTGTAPNNKIAWKCEKTRFEGRKMQWTSS